MDVCWKSCALYCATETGSPTKETCATVNLVNRLLSPRLCHRALDVSELLSPLSVRPDITDAGRTNTANSCICHHGKDVHSSRKDGSGFRMLVSPVTYMRNTLRANETLYELQYSQNQTKPNTSNTPNQANQTNQANQANQVNQTNQANQANRTNQADQAHQTHHQTHQTQHTHNPPNTPNQPNQPNPTQPTQPNSTNPTNSTECMITESRLRVPNWIRSSPERGYLMRVASRVDSVSMHGHVECVVSRWCTSQRGSLGRSMVAEPVLRNRGDKC